MSIFSVSSHRQSLNALCDQYKTEFYTKRVLLNLDRCKLFGIVILFINAVVLVVDFVAYSTIKLGNLTDFYLFYSHILIFCLILCWFLFLKLNQKRMNIAKTETLCNIFTIINLYWNVFMGLNNVYYSGQVSAYVICILGISVCLFLTPVEAFLLFFISLIFICLGLISIVDNSLYLYSNILNTSVAAIISYIIAKYKYVYFLKDFINNKNLIESKKELELTNQKLKEYEQLRADFFANISHELKTPINVISCAQQMMDNIVSQKSYKNYDMSKYLKMIKQNSYRLIRLVGNLIDITKIDSFNFEVKLINADIIKIVEDITISVVPFVESKGLSITFDTYLEEKIIACDPDQIERILLNLLSNAIKFTNKSGSILVSIYSNGDKICISVKDTGIGIPENMKSLIFDRFIQVDKSTSKNSEGCGIGLSLVKSLVEMHNGNIIVNSTLDQGSEFIVMLPDIILSESANKDLPVNNTDCVKKINIEFSDIYD